MLTRLTVPILALVLLGAATQPTAIPACKVDMSAYGYGLVEVPAGGMKLVEWKYYDTEHSVCCQINITTTKTGYLLMVVYVAAGVSKSQNYTATTMFGTYKGDAGGTITVSK